MKGLCRSGLVILFSISFAVSEGKASTTGPEPAGEPDKSIISVDYSTSNLLTWTERLRHDLLLHYDSLARPTLNPTNVTVVSMSMAITHVGLDEQESALVVNAWMRMGWTDEKLRWNASDYDGIDTMHFGHGEIWQPDITLYNNADNSEIDHYRNTHLLVYSNGEVLWVPPSHFYAYCQLNLVMWPYDEQRCTLRFGSWTHHGFQIDLEFYNNDSKIEKMNFYTENTEWEFVEGEGEKNIAFYSCCEEPYPEITYKIHLKRRSPSYRALVVLPGVVIALVTMSTFWLPPTCGEKLTINCVNMAIVSLFLLSFGHRLPAMGDHIPLLVLFYTNTFVLVALSVCIAVITLHFARSRRNYPAPWIVKSLFTSCVGNVLGLGHLIAMVSKTHNPLLHEGVEMQSAEELRGNMKSDFDAITPAPVPLLPGATYPLHNDWILVATGIDRIAFLVYTLINAILFMLLL